MPSVCEVERPRETQKRVSGRIVDDIAFVKWCPDAVTIQTVSIIIYESIALSMQSGTI